MLITKEVAIKINNSNIKRLIELFSNIKIGDIINIDVSLLSKGSEYKIEYMCDNCNTVKSTSYSNFYKSTKNDNFHLCKKCCYLKVKKNNLEKYGVENVFQLDETKEKIKQTNLEKIGVENQFQSNEIKENIKQINLNKYGVEHHTQSKIIKNNIIENNLIKYGVRHTSQLNYVIDKRIKTINENNFFKYKDIINDEYDLISFDNLIKILHKKCNNIFIIELSNLSNRLKYNTCLCTECYPIGDNKSIKEKEISNWLKKLNIYIIESNRTILEGKELDIYIPSTNLAIEFNGLYWHSEIYKENNYHLNKSIKCKNNNIHLIHIWEDEWVFKQDIVKSIILNRLNKIENKLFARKCTIKEVKDNKIVRQFLENNHIQGYSKSSIKLGLYHNDVLVSLMTFGYRNTISKKEVELIRFCNILNTNVIDASSKLFKHFLNNYSYDSIFSYSDFRMSDGKMYETLSFEYIYLSKPDYFWCKDLERQHKFTVNKQKLIKDGHDQNKTVDEIMSSRGYNRIWDCGQIRWEYKKI